MEAWGIVLMIVGVVLAGVATYLYNDGYDHKRVALVIGAVSIIGMVLSGAASQQDQADDAVNCSLYEESCPDYSGGLLPSLIRVVWNDLLKDMVVEIMLTVIACLIGFGIAKRTTREPLDERKPSIGFPED
jgi:hypothetical protein